VPRDSRVSYGVAVLLRRPRTTRVCLIKRAGAHAARQWAAPGGWVDLGEKARWAAIRELKEELGVTGFHADFMLFREEIHPDPQNPGKKMQSLSLYFEVMLPEGQEPRIMEPEKCSELMWVDVDDPTTWPTALFSGLESALCEYGSKLVVYGDE